MKNTRFIVQAAVIAALYFVLTWLQDIIWPGSGSLAIQFRFSEALCILAFFTPAAIPGLTIGCLLFNLICAYSAALPLDFLCGSLATALAALSMYGLRRVCVCKVPVLGLLMPALFNAILVGWELTFYFGEMTFWMNALYVAIGELAVVVVLGTILYFVLRRPALQKQLFGSR